MSHSMSEEWQIKAGCPKCNNGFTLKSVEVNGRIYEELQPCECWHRANAQRVLNQCGISAEELERYSMGAFKTDTAEAKTMKALAEAFLADQNATGIGYFGASGTGKTHICTAIVKELVERGRYVKYFLYLTEIQRLNSLYYEEKAYRDEVAKWSDVDVLYIDDLFKTPDEGGRKSPPNKRDVTMMLEIINNRIRARKTTIISSEYHLNEIKDIDEATGGRIYQLLKPHLMKCEGKNRRLRKENQ